MTSKNKIVLVFACVAFLGTGGCRTGSQQSNAPAQTGSQKTGAPDQELITAALQGNAERMEIALKAGANVNASDERLGSSLGGASYSGNLKAVRLLTDRGADLNVKDHNGMTPLMNATLGGNAEVVKHLIDKGADVNIASPTETNGRKVNATALLLARGSRHQDIVDILVAAGAKE